MSRFLSTLSLRRATARKNSKCRCLLISIHALLAESDMMFFDYAHPGCISIHALLAESDGVHFDNYNLHCTISIHALLAESDRSYFLGSRVPVKFLSTLSLRRATFFRHKKTLQDFNFYPRSPCGERLENPLRQIVNRCISIHALLAESDI